ncbi:hypothetical protein [Microbaculum marinum]|uniref:Uncharacterized protein n=1 Tax=Microbaculum marinum TaxID=1764581 RepID=A0AAW9RYX4_9HYPH
MQLLLKRSQGTTAILARPVFRLYARVEFEDDEEAIVKRYRFESAKLIVAIQPGLLRRSALVAAAVFVTCFILLARTSWQLAGLLGVVGGGAAGWLYFDRARETIFVKDLIHGRYFECKSIIELARKEAWLGLITSFLRQVMESAKHWDGTEAVPIDALSKQEAKYVVIRGL